MKKKALRLLLAAVLTFALAACSAGEVAGGNGGQAGSQTTVVPQQPAVSQQQPAPQQPAPQQPAPQQPAPQQPAPQVQLTRDQAKQIALAHAGVSENAVRDLEIELDRERGEPVYEVDFDAAGKEYSYDIHAQTGQILKAETERD